jgi:hypothetical protein
VSSLAVSAIHRLPQKVVEITGIRSWACNYLVVEALLNEVKGMTDLTDLRLKYHETDGGFWSNVAGVTFDGRQEHITDDLREIGLLLEPDPTNDYDANAIKVIRADNRKQVGFIKKEYAPRLAELFTKGFSPFIQKVVPTGGTPEKCKRGINIRLNCEGVDLKRFVFGGGSQTDLFGAEAQVGWSE